MRSHGLFALLLLSVILFAVGFFLPVTGPIVRGGQPFTGWGAFRHCVDMVSEHHTFVGYALGLAGISANVAMGMGLLCWLGRARQCAQVSAVAAIVFALLAVTPVWELVWDHPGCWVWLASFVLMFSASRQVRSATIADRARRCP
jgi:hypothetical protein